jgi:phosphate/sulfate permease
MAGAPPPIDPRGPRFNQAVLSVSLLAGYVVDWRPVAAIFAVVLLLGAAFGPQYGPFLRFYAEVIRPRLSPPEELEDPRPPRFAASVGVTFLTAATIAFAAGAPTVGWGLALVVAVLAGLSATTGICVGCEMWLFVARRRGVPLTGS